MVLISGASGFIGSNLAKRLKEKKIQFKYIKTSSILKTKENFFKDITCFIHLGFNFYKNKKRNIKKDINLLIIEKIVYLSNKFKFKIIFPSTSTYKYSKNKKISKNIFAYDVYSRSKINCEKKLVKNFIKNKIDTTILRIFNVYGNNQPKGWIITDLIKKIKRKSDKSISLNFYENTRDFIFIDDVVSAIIKSIKLKGLKILNVGTSIETSLLKLLKLLIKLFNSSKKINLLEKKSKSNYMSKANIAETQKILNWRPRVKLSSGLKQIIYYEQKKK